MDTYLIAIDPGKGGAFAVKPPDSPVKAFCFQSEAQVLADLSKCLQWQGTCVYGAILERVHAMPGQGVTSMFTFGANYGYWRGVLQALNVPFREVTPQRWQSGLNITAGLKGAERKRALAQVARERHPELKITLKNADAVLMLDYAKSVYL